MIEKEEKGFDIKKKRGKLEGNLCIRPEIVHKIRTEHRHQFT